MSDSALATGFEGPLAEFTALREEIVGRQRLQWLVFALQLTSGGAVFAFVISTPSRAAMLLIVPVTTYMLCGRFVMHYHAIHRIGSYIGTVLSDRVPGGLHWENWTRQRENFHLIPAKVFISPYFVAFPGVGVLALTAAPLLFLLNTDLSAWSVSGFAAVWCIGFVLTIQCFLLVWNMHKQWRI